MENEKDRLEELFRRSLGEGATQRPEGWNEPSPGVWDKIQTGSGPAGGPRFGLGFWRGVGIAAVVLLLVALFFICQNQREIDTLHDRLQAVEQGNENSNEKQVGAADQQDFSNENATLQAPISNENATLQAPISTDNKTLAGAEVLPSANDAAATADGGGLSANAGATSPKQRSGEHSASGNPQAGQRSDLPKANQSTPRPKTDGLAANASEPQPATRSAGQQENLPKANENTPQPETDGLQAIADGTSSGESTTSPPSTPEASLEQSTRPIAPALLTLPPTWVISQKEKENAPQVMVPGLIATLSGDPAPPITNHQSPKSYLGLTASPQFTLRQTTGLRPDQANQTTKSEMTAAAGLQAGFQLAPRWRLETGLQHSSSRVLTENIRRVNFRLQDEQPDQDGQLQSSYTLALATSGGTTDAEIELTRSPGMPVVDGRQIPIRLTVAHEARQLDLPLMANFRLLDGPLSIGLRGGVMARFGLKNTLIVEDVQVDLPAFRHRQNRFVGQVRDAKTDDLSLHLLAGIDVDYRISEHLSLSLSPMFAKALKPTADNGQTKIYLNTAGVNGGVRWWF